MRAPIAEEVPDIAAGEKLIGKAHMGKLTWIWD
jgi:hypothetical protein